MPFETADLLPRSTQVPGPLETDGVTIRQLTVADAERDFDAVTESRDRIRGTFGPETDWPPEDLTLEQNRIDVAWHQKEHQRRDAFTYAVVDPSDTTEYGCLYVQPTRNLSVRPTDPEPSVRGDSVFLDRRVCRRRWTVTGDREYPPRVDRGGVAVRNRGLSRP